MKRSDITELHYIAPIENVPSILKHGILSHNQAKKIDHDSVAMREIQERALTCTMGEYYRKNNRPFHEDEYRTGRDCLNSDVFC
jgi:hypothetical protein